jgi:hypothetical protein
MPGRELSGRVLNHELEPPKGILEESSSLFLCNFSSAFPRTVTPADSSSELFFQALASSFMF